MPATIEQSVLESIDNRRDEIVSFLRELIAFPSVTGEEGQIQQFLADHLQEMGLEVDTWIPDIEELKKHPAYIPVTGNYDNRPNAVGVLRGSGEGRRRGCAW